jgi:hypothetical protein
MVAEAQLAGDLYAAGFGLHAVELNALLRFIALHAVQAVKEIEVPPRAAELAVGDYFQAAGALVLYHLADRFVFDLAQGGGVDFPGLKLLAGLLDNGRTQKTSYNFGAVLG